MRRLLQERLETSSTHDAEIMTQLSSESLYEFPRIGSLPNGAYSAFPPSEALFDHAWEEIEVAKVESGVSLHAFTCTKCGAAQLLRVYRNGLVIDMKRPPRSCGEALVGLVHNS